MASVENEDDLLAIAEYGTASHIEKTVRHFRRVSKERAQCEHEKRFVSYRWDDEGNLIVNAKLSAEQGALFLKALENNADALEQEEWKTGLEETIEDKNVFAETLPENVRHLAPELPARRMNRRADALVLMAEAQLDHVVVVSKTADQYQVTIHVDDF